MIALFYLYNAPLLFSHWPLYRRKVCW